MAVIAQRLIAAGASPERARAFEQQYTQRLQGAQPGLTRPQDIQDAFDAEIAAFAAAAYPNVFRPPTIDDPRIDAYITGIYGANKLPELTAKAWTTEAPNYIKVANSITPQEAQDVNTIKSLDKYIVRRIAEGASYADLVNEVLNNRMDLMGALTEGKVADITTKYFNEYNKAQESIPTYKQKLLESNKYYKVGLPDPSFKYGLKEDLAAGVIDFTTHPSVTRILETKPKIEEKEFTPYGPSLKAIRESAPTLKSNVINDLLATGATPFRDEVKRREYLKKRTTK